MVVVAPLQKYSNRADESATATKRVRVRFLSAIEVQGGPYLKGYVKGMSLPLIESFFLKKITQVDTFTFSLLDWTGSLLAPPCSDVDPFEMATSAFV